jgi:LPS export ABC transporter protein LptC
MFSKRQVLVLFQRAALFAGFITAISCSNKKEIPVIEDGAKVPTLQMKQMDIVYTEYGKIKMTLVAPVLERYMLAEEPYSLFPHGFFVKFFTPDEILESDITADYALYKEKPVEIWEATGHVVVNNYLQSQKLFTDTLYWNRQEHTIYTSAPVHIETTDGIINGRNGMTSDEKFMNYEIREIGDSRYYFDDPQNKTQATDSLTLQQK